MTIPPLPLQWLPHVVTATREIGVAIWIDGAVAVVVTPAGERVVVSLRHVEVAPSPPA